MLSAGMYGRYTGGMMGREEGEGRVGEGGGGQERRIALRRSRIGQRSSCLP